jgi:hypothetical protein
MSLKDKLKSTSVMNNLRDSNIVDGTNILGVDPNRERISSKKRELEKPNEQMKIDNSDKISPEEELKPQKEDNEIVGNEENHKTQNVHISTNLPYQSDYQRLKKTRSIKSASELIEEIMNKKIIDYSNEPSDPVNRKIKNPINPTENSMNEELDTDENTKQRETFWMSVEAIEKVDDLLLTARSKVKKLKRRKLKKGAIVEWAIALLAEDHEKNGQESYLSKKARKYND